MLVSIRLLVLCVGFGMFAPWAQAQVVVVGPPGPLPPFGMPYPVRAAYSVPYVSPLPVPVYGAAYAAPTVVTVPVVTPVYRPVVVGPGLGGLPNAYVPGQPVRNTLRFLVP